MRMLLVDDEPAIRAVINRVLLRQFDLDIVECENGLEALELLTRERFGLVMLDCRMPVFDGLDTLRTIRASAVLSRMPVIMMTGVSDDGVVQRILECGVAAYVVKPLRPAQLLERVSRVLTTIRETDSLPTTPVFQPLELSAESSVMIADGSPEFRQFFQRRISSVCRVREADSGLMALRSCLTSPPTALFIGADLDVLSGELLAQKIRDSSRLDGIRLIGVMPPHLLRRARKGSPYEAVILRTFIPDLFLDGFGALLRRPGRLAGLLTTIPDLKLVGIAAFEEVLGSTLNAAAVPRVPKTRDNSKHACGEVTIRLGKDRTPLLVQLGLGHKHLKRLSSCLLKADVSWEGDQAEAPLLELLSRIAKSLAQEFAHRTLDVEIGEVAPRSSLVRPIEQPDDAISVEFDVAGTGLCLRLDMSLPDGYQSTDPDPALS